MTKRDVGSLALTIVGLYAIVAAIKYAGTMVGLIESAARAEHSEATLRYVVVGSMLAFGALIAVGCVLLVFSGELSARMFDDGEEKVAVSASLRDVQAAAFSVVGLLFIFFSLPSLLRSTARVLLSLDHHMPSADIRADEVAHALGMLAVMIMGLKLFFRGRSVSDRLFGPERRVVRAEKGDESS